MSGRPGTLQATIALGVLVIGVLVYLLDRQPETVYFIPDWITLTKSGPLAFGDIGQQLPTFIHTFAFILLTAAIVAPSSLQMVFICVAWFVVEAFFEAAQITPIAHWIAGHIPDGFTGIPFLENTAAYFIHGTFDYLDLVSIAAGAVLAYLVILLSQNGRKHHVHAI